MNKKDLTTFSLMFYLLGCVTGMFIGAWM